MFFCLQVFLPQAFSDLVRELQNAEHYCGFRARVVAMESLWVILSPDVSDIAEPQLYFFILWA